MFFQDHSLGNHFIYQCQKWSWFIALDPNHGGVGSIGGDLALRCLNLGIGEPNAVL